MRAIRRLTVIASTLGIASDCRAITGAEMAELDDASFSRWSAKSPMVLSDDTFASIIAAVEEGPAIFDNIRRLSPISPLVEHR